MGFMAKHILEGLGSQQASRHGWATTRGLSSSRSLSKVVLEGLHSQQVPWDGREQARRLDASNASVDLAQIRSDFVVLLQQFQQLSPADQGQALALSGLNRNVSASLAALDSNQTEDLFATFSADEQAAISELSLYFKIVSALELFQQLSAADHDQTLRLKAAYQEAGADLATLEGDRYAELMLKFNETQHAHMHQLTIYLNIAEVLERFHSLNEPDHDQVHHLMEDYYGVGAELSMLDVEQANAIMLKCNETQLASWQQLPYYFEIAELLELFDHHSTTDHHDVRHLKRTWGSLDARLRTLDDEHYDAIVLKFSEDEQEHLEELPIYLAMVELLEQFHDLHAADRHQVQQLNETYYAVGAGLAALGANRTDELMLKLNATSHWHRLALYLEIFELLELSHHRNVTDRAQLSATYHEVRGQLDMLDANKTDALMGKLNETQRSQLQQLDTRFEIIELLGQLHQLNATGNASLGALQVRAYAEFSRLDPEQQGELVASIDDAQRTQLDEAEAYVLAASSTSTTTTATATTTTSTTTTATSTSTNASEITVAKVAGNFSMQVSDPGGFVSDPDSAPAVARGLSDVVSVPPEHIEVNLSVTSPASNASNASGAAESRRLDSGKGQYLRSRRLQDGQVRVDYIISLRSDDDHTVTAEEVADTISTKTAEDFTAAIAAQTDGQGSYTVEVLSKSDPQVTVERAPPKEPDPPVAVVAHRNGARRRAGHVQQHCFVLALALLATVAL